MNSDPGLNNLKEFAIQSINLQYAVVMWCSAFVLIYKRIHFALKATTAEK